MYHSPYNDQHTSELAGLVLEVAQIADDLRKIEVITRRRGAGGDDPLTTELVAGKRALLHDRLQYFVSLQGRLLRIQEAKKIAEEKVRQITALIADTNKYISGTGSEIDFLLAQVITSGVQEIMAT